MYKMTATKNVKRICLVICT